VKENAVSEVREHMSSPAVTVGPDLPVPEVIALLGSRAISAAPVLDSGRLVGIVSTTDLIAADENSRETARDRMTAQVVTAKAAEALEDAARRLVAARVHRLVVVDHEGRVEGVLSARDVLEALKERKVAEPIACIMRPDVAVVEVGDPISLALERLANARVHGLVVMAGSMPIGVFTHAEALAARRLPPSLREGPVEDAMSYETVCLDASTPVYRAAGYAMSMNVRRILAVHDRRFVGILSVLDLVAALSRAA
jgi:CBS domain-containing protein